MLFGLWSWCPLNINYRRWVVIQVQARGNALCRGQPERDDQGVRVVRRFDGQAVVDPWTFLSRLRVWGGQGRERGVEHSFSRPRRRRSGMLRINVPRNRRSLVCERIAPRFVHACGDCAPCGYLGICKARRGNRKPYPQGANGVSRERVG